MEKGDKVARKAALGTVVAILAAGERPEGFKGDWPESPQTGVAAIAWPGRKKLTVEPLSALTVIPQ